jgi:hypothetical protein
MEETEQAEMWRGEFGETYTTRNPQDLEELDKVFSREHGVSRTELNREFLDGIDRHLKMLEVGTNTGLFERGGI